MVSIPFPSIISEHIRIYSKANNKKNSERDLHLCLVLLAIQMQDMLGLVHQALLLSLVRVDAVVMLLGVLPVHVTFPTATGVVVVVLGTQRGFRDEVLRASTTNSGGSTYAGLRAEFGGAYVACATTLGRKRKRYMLVRCYLVFLGGKGSGWG